MNINKLLTTPEGKTLEFKRDTSALKQIMRTIVAFANTSGGTLDNFRAGTSIIRNHTIAKVLRHLSLMEEWGSGYRRIEASCIENGYDIPEWFEIGPTIRVVSPPRTL